MGAADSKQTRRVVVERDDIMVTQDVMKRLTGREADKSSGREKDDQEKEYSIPPNSLKRLEAKYERKLKHQEELTIAAEENLKKFQEQLMTQIQNEKQQFQQAVEDTNKKLIRMTGSPVCQDLQEKVYHCYRNNPNETLNCSSDVRAFSACVVNARENAYDMAKKG